MHFCHSDDQSIVGSSQSRLEKPTGRNDDGKVKKSQIEGLVVLVKCIFRYQDCDPLSVQM